MEPRKVDANESLRASQVALGFGDGAKLPFLCECDDVGCRAILQLTGGEYSDARASALRYVVVEGHRYEGSIVRAGEGYLLVEKDA